MSKNGGAAFPYNPVLGVEPGMALRDYFAAKAMQGMNASPALFEAVTAGDIGTPLFERMAFKAYEQADAMLKAREA